MNNARQQQTPPTTFNAWGQQRQLVGGKGEALLRISEPDEAGGPMTLAISGTLTASAQAGEAADVVLIARVEWGSGNAGHTRDFLVGFASRVFDVGGGITQPAPAQQLRKMVAPFACARINVTLRLETSTGQPAPNGASADVACTVSRGNTGEPRRTALWIPPNAAASGGGAGGLIFPRGADLIRVQGANWGADTRIMLFDKASAPLLNDVPKASFFASAGSNFSDDRWPNGRPYAFGIWWAASSTIDVYTPFAGSVTLEAEIEG